MCINITITNDEAFEKDEYFTVLVASEMNVMVQNNLTVHISDDDSKGIWEWIEILTHCVYLLSAPPAVVYVEFVPDRVLLSESDGSFQACVQLAMVAEPTQAEIWLTFSSADDTATGQCAYS